MSPGKSGKKWLRSGGSALPILRQQAFQISRRLPGQTLPVVSWEASKGLCRSLGPALVFWPRGTAEKVELTASQCCGGAQMRIP